MEIFKIKRNDTKPYLAVNLFDNTGSAVDLTTASGIYFNLADSTFTPVISGSCTITGSLLGQCEYRWSATDTARSGTYWGEFEITYTDGTILTMPSDHSLKVQISEDYD